MLLHPPTSLRDATSVGMVRPAAPQHGAPFRGRARPCDDQISAPGPAGQGASWAWARGVLVPPRGQRMRAQGGCGRMGVRALRRAPAARPAGPGMGSSCLVSSGIRLAGPGMGSAAQAMPRARGGGPGTCRQATCARARHGVPPSLSGRPCGSGLPSSPNLPLLSYPNPPSPLLSQSTSPLLS
jgi:hypothetical protein